MIVYSRRGITVEVFDDATPRGIEEGRRIGRQMNAAQTVFFVLLAACLGLFALDLVAEARALMWTLVAHFS